MQPNYTKNHNTGKTEFWKNVIFLWGARSGVHAFSDPQTQLRGQDS